MNSIRTTSCFWRARSVEQARGRSPPAGATGALGDPTGATAPKARVSYTAIYYDAANRETDSVDVGTNGGIAYTRPSSVPASSDTALVTHTEYGSNGMPSIVTDPRGIQNLTQYDLLGRTTETIAAFTPSTGSGQAVPTDSTNQTTAYTYDGNDDVLTMTAVMPSGTPSQTTEYVYGTDSSSGIFSNDLISKVEYPDATSGAASSSASNDVSYTHDAAGEVITKTDQSGTTHTYSHDVLGRRTLDAVTTLGTGVDGAVLAIGTTYNTQGLPEKKTSYSDAGATSVVDQVQDEYNGQGQLTNEYQSHDGAVDTATTPQVQYAYSAPANGSRQTSMTYPNGRVLDYQYAGGLDDAIGRVTSLADGNATSTPVVTYSYLGLGTIVQQADGNGITLSYVQQPGDTVANSNGGDQYTGLDRFGRVLDQNWVNTSTGASTDRFQYAYDRNGNVLYKNNLVNSSFSELYHANSATTGDNNSAYDALNRLIGFARGTLSASGHNGDGLDTVSTASHGQTWNLGALGNWNTVTTDGTTQSRTTNAKNELTQAGTSSLTFDNNGNTTTDDQGQTFKFDPWNRMVLAKNASGATLSTYAYDANGWRIIENPGTQTDLYYSNQWQVLEERQGTTTTKQDVWGEGYVDDLVLRDDNSATGNLGKSGSGLGQRLYVQQDANYNVTALVGTDGLVKERLVYDPYGSRTVLSPTWGAASDAYGFLYGHQGGRLDVATGLYNFRNRDYSVALGRWTEQDPAAYIGGPNTYQYVASAPSGKLDAGGLQVGTVVVRVATAAEIDFAFVLWGIYKSTESLGNSLASAYDDEAGVGAECERVMASYHRPAAGWGGPRRAPGPTTRPAPATQPAPSATAQPTTNPAPGSTTKPAQPRGGTYVLIDPTTGQIMRTGQTNDLERRKAEHARLYPDYVFQIDKRTDDYAARRGREQILHDGCNPAPPLDKQSPIDPNNPRRNEYLEAGKQLGK